MAKMVVAPVDLHIAAETRIGEKPVDIE